MAQAQVFRRAHVCEPMVRRMHLVQGRRSRHSSGVFLPSLCPWLFTAGLWLLPRLDVTLGSEQPGRAFPVVPEVSVP